MKQPPELDEVARNMAPGKITRNGFLGTDMRRLHDILIEDDAAVKRLGLTHQQISARMRQLTEKGEAGLGLPRKVNKRLEVTVEAVRGKLPCPFAHQGVYPKINTIVTNIVSKKSVTYTELSIHLIGAHGFYGGRDSHFRLDPQKLAELLEIVPRSGGDCI